MKWLTYYRLEIVFLCVSYFFFPPSIFFLPAPALLLIILPTHAHTVPDTCLKGFAQPRQPVSHFTFHPAALLYLSVFFFFHRDIYRTIFRSPGQFPRRPLKINSALRPVEALRTYVCFAIRCEWNRQGDLRNTFYGVMVLSHILYK